MQIEIQKALLGGVLFISSIADVNAHDHAKLRGRLVFSDFEKPIVSILDLDNGAVTHNFPLPKPNAALATSENGRYIIVTTGDENGTVRILDNGLISESHGDHKDVEKSEPHMLDYAITGDRPAHVISQNGWISIFHDGQRPWERKSGAKATLIELKSLSSKKVNVETWVSSAPQHGIALPLGRSQWLMSEPNPIYAKGDDKSASSRPNGFAVFERAKSWKQVASFNDQMKSDASCKLFHGFSSIGTTHFFGCNEGINGGILMITKLKSGKWKASKIAYHDDRRTSALKGKESARYLVGNYGLKTPYDALVRVNLITKKLNDKDVMAIPDGQPVCQFELSENGKQVVNLTPDGKLSVYDVASDWKKLVQYQAVPAFDCAFNASAPKSRLAIIGKSAYISDPMGKRIREFHLDTLKEGLDFPIDGIPTNIANGD